MVYATPLREVRAQPTGATSITVTFVEPDALDSTHLLICVANTNNDTMSAAGWSLAEQLLTNDAFVGRQVAIWARRGDGATNGITITSSTAITKMVMLYAFRGFVSTTPLAHAAGFQSSAGPTAVTTGTTPPGRGVAIVGAVANNGSSVFFGLTGYSHSWPNSPLLTDPRGLSFDREYAGTDASGSLSYGGSAYVGWASAIFELAGSWSLALGSVARTPQLGAEPQTYAAQVMADSPGMYWRLGEMSGTVATDSSGNGRDGTYIGTTTPAEALVTGETNLARDFPGGSNPPGGYIEIPWASWQDATVFTVEVLIKVDSFASPYFAIITDDGLTSPYGRWWNLYLMSNRKLHYNNPSDTGGAHDFICATPLSPGVTYHVAMVCSSTGVRIYLNGVLDGQNSNPVNTPPSNSRVFAVSASASGTSTTQRFFGVDGVIDEVAWYPSALSAARILAHYTAANLALPTNWLPSALSGLISWYDADDASTFSFSSGTVVSQWRDKSAGAHHLAQATTSLQPSRSGAINGRTAVTFDGVDDYMDTSSFTQAQPFTVFLAMNILPQANQGWFSSVGGNVQTYVGSNAVGYYAGSAIVSPGGSHLGTHQWMFQYNGASSEARRDRAIGTGGNPGTSGTTTGWRIAERNLTAGYRLKGDLGEILVYNRVLTSTEKALVEAYLESRWL